MITYFAFFFLFFVLIFYQDDSRISRFHSMSTKQRQMRQQEIVGLYIIQNMFGDSCNENSISVKIKAICSAVTNVICIKMLICLRFITESTFTANVEEDICVDQSLLTAYFMQINILHRIPYSVNTGLLSCFGYTRFRF